MKIKSFILILFLGLQIIHSQNLKAKARAERLARLDSLPSTIENQFKKTYGKAGDWKEFKMIKRTDFSVFQKTILDSVSKIKNELKTKQEIILNQQVEVDSLKTSITNLNTELTEYKNAESTENNTRIMFFSIIGALLIGLLFFLFKYRNSNSVTKIAKKNLADVEEEFEQHRKNTLEREQKLRRQLQDEINKQRGV